MYDRLYYFMRSSWMEVHRLTGPIESNDPIRERYPYPFIPQHLVHHQYHL